MFHIGRTRSALHNDLTGIGGSLEVLELSICPDLHDQHHQSPVLVQSLSCKLHLSLSSMVPRARGQSSKIGGEVAKLKSDPDVRCFLNCPVQPITMVSEVVPGAAAGKAKFISSLVYCALVLVLLTDAPPKLAS